MGLIAPTALFVVLPIVWAFNQLGWHPASQVFFWIGPFLLYVLLPALDLRFGPRRAEPARRGDGAAGERQVLPLLHLHLHPVPVRQRDLRRVPVHRVEPELARAIDGGLSWVAKIGLALSVGVLGGIGINTAHELGHKKDSLERWLSKITLAQTCYGHFYIEHNRGHHVRVATPEDPASARFGETFWEFLPRSVWGSLRSAWQLEARPAAPAGQEPVAPDRNDVLNAWAMSVVFFGVADRGVRSRADPLHLIIQAVFGFTLLETVELPRALRTAAAEARQRPVRAVHARAQLELRPPRDQPVPVPPAAAQRSPRQPDPALPDAAQHGRRAEPAQRLRHR